MFGYRRKLDKIDRQTQRFTSFRKWISNLSIRNPCSKWNTISVWNPKHHKRTSNSLCGAKRNMNDSVSRVRHQWPTHVCYTDVMKEPITPGYCSDAQSRPQWKSPYNHLPNIDLHSLWHFVLPSYCLFISFVLLIVHSLVCPFILSFRPSIILLYICPSFPTSPLHSLHVYSVCLCSIQYVPPSGYAITDFP